MKRVFKNKNSQKLGFSLVEVLLAVVLLAIIVTPLMQVIVSSMAMNKKSRQLLAATNCAESLMEYLEGETYEDFIAEVDTINKAAAGTVVSYPCIGFNGTKEALSNSYTRAQLLSMGYTPAYDSNTDRYIQFESFKNYCNLICYTKLSSGKSDTLFIYSPADFTDEDKRPDVYAFTDVVYEGYKFDAYVMYDVNPVTDGDQFELYNIRIDVYPIEKGIWGNHSCDTRLCSISGSTLKNYDVNTD